MLLLLGTLLSSGCAAIGPFFTQSTESTDEAIEYLEQGAQQPRLPPPVPVTSVVVAPQKEPEVSGPSFDLAVDEADAPDFFRGLVVDTPFNIVIHPDVAGTVSLDLRDVTVPDVMRVMRDVYGYDYTLHKNVYQVFPDVLRTEIYNLNYLNIARAGRSEIQVSAGKVSDAGNNNNNNNNNNGNNNQNNGGGKDGGGGGQVVGTIVNTSAESDLWTEIQITLESIVSLDEGSHVMVTPQVGLIVVKAKPQTLRAVDDYLTRVEDMLTRQVVLEAKIIEVTLRDGFQAGIDWNSFGDASGGVFDPVPIELPDGSLALAGGSEHSVAGEFLSGVNDIFNPLGAGFSLNTAFGDFDATIDLLATQGSVQVLSSPRIATVNNQKAVIKVGNDEFFITELSSNTVTAGSAINTNDSAELTPFFSGIALDVTPQISERNDVILHVHPTISEVTEQLKDIGGQLVPLAASTIRESDSIVRAQSGQIIVIGGLMQNSSTDTNAGVPWLSKIPIIGNFFKQKNRSSIKSELVILLKPMVIEPGVQETLLGNSATNASELRRLMRSRG